MSSSSGIDSNWWGIFSQQRNSEYRWCSQIAVAMQNRQNGVYYRSGLNDNTGWGDWVKLASVTEVNSKVSGYLPLSGGSMTGAIKFNQLGTCYISYGEKDFAPTVDSSLANLTISSWNGISFTTDCSSNHRKVTSVGIDTRHSIVYATNFVGALTGNATTATTLQTARTIWGQSFDGTGNIANCGAKFYQICIETTNEGGTHNERSAEINCYANILYLQHNSSTNCVICTGGGNVGIGTTSPSYKLDVTGTSHFSDSIWNNGSIYNNNGLSGIVFGRNAVRYKNWTFCNTTETTTNSIQIFSSMDNGSSNSDIGGICITPDGITMFNSGDCGSVIRIFDKDKTQDFTDDTLASFRITDKDHGCGYVYNNLIYTAGNLINVSQLTNDVHYITSSSIYTDVTTDTIYFVGVTNAAASSSAFYKINNGMFYGNTSGLFFTSDVRKKHNISSLTEYDVDKYFENDYFKHFVWNHNNKSSYGVIAQENINWCPEAVDIDKDGNFSVNYWVAQSKAIGALTHKIKEQQNQMEEMKNKLIIYQC